MTSPLPDSRPPVTPMWLEVALFAGILVVALILRVVDLRGAPPGAQHDEVFAANFATQILNGAHPVYWDQNGGVPPLHAYLVAAAFAAFGANIVSLRLVSVLCGLASIVCVYLASRRLFGGFVALFSAALMSVAHWHLFQSRVGLEPITLTLAAAATVWFFSALQVGGAEGSRSGGSQTRPYTPSWSGSGAAQADLTGFEKPVRSLQRRALASVALGVIVGLALYTYQSAPLIPVALAAFSAYLFVWHRPRFKRQWRGLALMFAVALVVGAPLVWHLLTTEGDAVSRTEDLSADLRAALNGDVEPLARNVSGVFGMFAFAGDPSWRYNTAGRPLFTPLVGLLAYAGFALCLRRWRDPRYAFVVIWIVCNVIASAVTRASPSFLRSSAALPLVVCLPPLALDALMARLGLRSQRSINALTRPNASRVAALFFVLAVPGLLLWEAASTTRDYFTIWATNGRVRDTYRADLAEIAAFLDAQKPAGTIMLSARFASDLDQGALYLLQQQKQRYQWFNGRRVLVLPDDRSGQGVSYFIPATNQSLGEGAGLLQTLEAHPGARDEKGNPSFTLYYLPPETLQRLRAPAPRFPLRANVSNEVELIGVDARASERSLHVVLYWRVLLRVPGDRDRNFFAHLVDADGKRWAQEDRSAYPTSSWQDDDIVWQWYDLALPPDAPAGAYAVELGVYDANASAQPRLDILDGSGAVVSNHVRVGPFELR